MQDNILDNTAPFLFPIRLTGFQKLRWDSLGRLMLSKCNMIMAVSAPALWAYSANNHV